MQVSGGAGIIADSFQASPGQTGRRSPAGAPAFSHGIIVCSQQVSKPGVAAMSGDRGSLPGAGSGTSASQRVSPPPPAGVAPRRGRAGSIAALILLATVCGICFSLGKWQLGRAEVRDALHSQIQHGRQQTPLQLSASVAPADLTPWRPATAHGQWSSAHTVLLENRNLDGRPGYWVATPLLLAAPPAPFSRNDAVTAGSAELDAVTGRSDASEFLGRGPGSDATAILVLRGWVPRDLQAAGLTPEIPVESGPVSIQGELHAHVPRIFELWQWAGGAGSSLPSQLPQAGGAPAQVQNLDLAEFARASGLHLLPTVLAQTHPTDFLAGNGTAPGASAQSTPTEPGRAHALRREWPGPSLDSDQNRGYALQWFSFSAIALIAALFVLRGLFRRSRQVTKEAS